MEITLEENGKFDRILTITLPASQVDQSIEAEIANLARSVKIPGFRPGKVPRSLLETRYRETIASEVTHGLITNSIPHALREKGLVPVVTPEIKEVSRVTRGANLTFKMALQVFPEPVTPGDCTTLEVARPVVKIADADIDEVIGKVRDRNATYVAVESGSDYRAQAGDILTISFTGSLGGAAVPEATVADYPVTLGSGRVMKEFEEGLLGATAGANLEITVNFPASYAAAKLAGQPVGFQVTVNQLKRKALPEVDDALAATVGFAEGGVAALRTDIATRLQQQAADAIQKLLRKRVMDAVFAAHQLELPSQLVNEEFQGLLKQVKEEWKEQGIPLPDDPEFLKEVHAKITQDAYRRVVLGLVLGAIAKERDLEPSPSDLETRLDQIVGQQQDTAKIKNQIRNKPELWDSVKASVVEQQVLDWIATQARTTDEELSFTALMEMFQPSAPVSPQ